MPDIMKMGKNPNYLGSWDIDDAPGHELILTIKVIKDEEVMNNGKKEICTVCYFVEGYKPMILNITNKKTICKLYKTKDTDKLAGKLIAIHTEKVKAFGDIHDALRIKKEIPKAKIQTEAVINCEVCTQAIVPANGMTALQLASYTSGKYGKRMCSRCATEYASSLKGATENDTN